ncbi:MAG: B12-binding domain-containing radical SAM protein, partial [Pseudomonadota bacterium]
MKPTLLQTFPDEKILLVKLKDPSFHKQKTTLIPPIGLLCLREAITDRDRVTILDENLGESLETHLETNQYDIIGLSVMFSAQHSQYLQAAKLAKKHAKIIIAGGHHAAFVPPPPGIDILIRGQGEPFFTRGQINIAFPKPAYNFMVPYWNANLPHDLQSKTKRWFPTITSRGCPYKCGYCTMNNFWGSPQFYKCAAIYNHFTDLATIGIKEIFIEDDNLTLNKDHFKMVIDALKFFDFWWSTPNGISPKSIQDPTTLNLINNSKCWRLSLAFETGVEATASKMGTLHSYLPYKKAEQLVKNISNMNIKTCGFFIIGYPGETQENIRTTLEYANALPLDDRYIYIATPYPGTELFNICIDHKILKYSPPELYEHLWYTEGLIDTPEFHGAQIEQIKQADREKALRRKDE